MKEHRGEHPINLPVPQHPRGSHANLGEVVEAEEHARDVQRNAHHEHAAGTERQGTIEVATPRLQRRFLHREPLLAARRGVLGKLTKLLGQRSWAVSPLDKSKVLRLTLRYRVSLRGHQCIE